MNSLFNFEFGVKNLSFIGKDSLIGTDMPYLMAWLIAERRGNFENFLKNSKAREDVRQLWKDKLLSLKLNRDLDYVQKLEHKILSGSKQRCRLCKLLFHNKDFITHYGSCQKNMKMKIKVMEISDKIIQNIKGFEMERKKVRISLEIPNIQSKKKESPKSFRRKSVTFSHNFGSEIEEFNAALELFEKYKAAAITLCDLSKAFKNYVKELKMDSFRAIHDNLIRQKLKRLTKNLPCDQLEGVLKHLYALLELIEMRLIQVNSIVTKEKLIQSKKTPSSSRVKTLQDLSPVPAVKSKYLCKVMCFEDDSDDLKLERMGSSDSISGLDSMSSKQGSCNSADSNTSIASKKHKSKASYSPQRKNAADAKENFNSCVSDRAIQIPGQGFSGHLAVARHEFEEQLGMDDGGPTSFEDLGENLPKKSCFSKYASYTSLQKPLPHSGYASPTGMLKESTPAAKKVKIYLCDQYDRLTVSDSGEYFKNDVTLVGKISRVSLSDFYFVKTLGKGAFGTVFLVQSKSRPDDVFALKIINKASNMTALELSNLLTERNIFGIVEGEFVTHAISSFVHRNLICFLMEFMPGGDLGKLLSKEEYFDEDWARFYLAEIILGLESLHKKGICHRDLKPENLLISQTGHLKLADYGLSDIKKELVLNNTAENFEELYFSSQFEMMNTPLEKEEKLSALHQKMVPKANNAGLIRVAGTPDYIAPEILKEGLYSPAADFWALGVIAYELLTNCPPFNGPTVDVVFENIKHMNINWLPTGTVF